jgi:hypothetical protein
MTEKTAQQRWRERNPNGAREAAARWRKAHPERAKAATARWRAKNPEKVKFHNRKRTAEERRNYKRHITGLPFPARPEPIHCECCGCIQTRQALALDHVHRTGEFRGRLCNRCNLGIGHLGDTAAGVALALIYICNHEGIDPAKLLEMFK